MFYRTLHKPGDLVLFHLSGYGRLIKRVAQLHPQDGTITVLGTALESMDSRRFGDILIKTITGRVIWHVKKDSSTSIGLPRPQP